MIAGLPMYDLPEVREATDAWWAGVRTWMRRHGIRDVPDRLERTLGPERLWSHPELLLSQSCGYPLTHGFSSVLEPVVTPCYGAPGCSGARYCSALLVRADTPVSSLGELRGAVAAFSSEQSHSGYNVLRAEVASLRRAPPFFSSVVRSGSHRSSLAWIASGRADVAAVDCVTHALLAHHAPWELEGTRVLGWTRAAPGLPYVTARGANPWLVERMRRALRDAVRDPATESARRALLLENVQEIPREGYREIQSMQEQARAAGYDELR